MHLSSPYLHQLNALDKRLRLWLGQYCVYCEVPCETLLCKTCTVSLLPMGVHCQSCTREVAVEQTICGQCLQSPHAIDCLHVAYRYRSPLREIVLQAKYGRNRGALDILRQLLLKACPPNLNADLIVPMPISKRRLAQRGFNQTHALAHALSRCSGIKMVKDVLIKQTRKAQSKLNDDASRRANIKGAFSASTTLQGHVVLVDDIVTSGATAKEAAAALKAAGAEKVTFICVAAR